jgi:hypothetical protein
MELLDRSLAPLLGPVAVLAAQLTAGVAVYTALMLRSEPHVLAVLRARRQTSAAAVR